MCCIAGRFFTVWVIREVNPYQTNAILCPDKKGHGPKAQLWLCKVPVLAEKRQSSADGALRARSPDSAQLSPLKGARCPAQRALRLLRPPKEGRPAPADWPRQTANTRRSQRREWGELLRCLKAQAKAGGWPWWGLRSPADTAPSPRPKANELKRLREKTRIYLRPSLQCCLSRLTDGLFSMVGCLWAGPATAPTNGWAGPLAAAPWQVVAGGKVWGADQWLSRTCCLVTDYRVMMRSNGCRAKGCASLHALTGRAARSRSVCSVASVMPISLTRGL